MRQSMVLAIVCGVVAVACLGGGALFFVERPTVIKVAIPTDAHGDYGLLSAAGKMVRRGHHPIRFKVVPTTDAKSAAAELDQGNVDMAVVRTDETMPADGQTIVVLHRDAAVLVAPGPSELKTIGDLAGHKVGIVNNQVGNRVFLDTVLDQYEVARGSVTVVPLTPDGIVAAIKAKQVDVVLVVGIISGTLVQGAVKAVTDAGEGPPVFLEVDDSQAIAQRSPAYDSFEVAKGAFHGSPPQPAEEFNTLSVTHRLVARTALSDTIAADVTRFFLSERSALVAIDPIARRIEAPSTDKGAPFPAHPGTAAYIDDKEQTFLEQYSDLIYLGAMFFGVLASGATAIFSRINALGARAVEQFTVRLIEILKLVRYAPTLDLVNALEAETDEIVATALHGESVRGLDEMRLSTLGLALSQVREAIRDRRAMLETPLRAPIASDFASSHILTVD